MINESDKGKRVRFLGGNCLDENGNEVEILGRILDADYANVKVEWDDGQISTYSRARVERSLEFAR